MIYKIEVKQSYPLNKWGILQTTDGRHYVFANEEGAKQFLDK